MDILDILNNKKILAVDDDPDILSLLKELLPMCSLETASTFRDAKALLEKNTYDAAILDIMGVKGYRLLEITRSKNIPSLMLTAHALTPENLKQAIEMKADAYVPKERMTNIAAYVSDMLAARKEGRQNHEKWFSLLKPTFDKLFGEGWRKKDRQFWDAFDTKQISSRDDIQKMK